MVELNHQTGTCLPSGLLSANTPWPNGTLSDVRLAGKPTSAICDGEPLAITPLIFTLLLHSVVSGILKHLVISLVKLVVSVQQ